MRLCKKNKIIKFIFFAILTLIYIKILKNITGTACVVSGVTGFPCPGCGMTRAWISFLKGDITNAFKYNPLYLLVLFIAIGYLIIYIKNIKLKRLNKIIFTILVVFLMVYVIRMILYFPNVEPMTYNKNAFLPQITELFNR